MEFSEKDLCYSREVQRVQPFYLQNQAGLFLTNDAEDRQITAQEQDFSKNQTWFLSFSERDWGKYFNIRRDKDEFGKLFCGNGACLSTQGEGITVESDSTDQDYGHLKFYFHHIGDNKFYITKCEDKIKKFEDDKKQDFLAIIDGKPYMGPIEDAPKHSEEEPIIQFTWKKVDPSGPRENYYKDCIYQWATMYPEAQLPKDEKYLPLSQLPKYAFAAGEESGDKVFLGKRGSHVGKVHNEIKYLGFHHEDGEAFDLRNQHGFDNAVRVVSDGIGDAIDVLCISPEAEVDWVDYENGKLPICAVIACVSDGIYYVGRGIVNDDTIPGIFLHKKIDSEEKSEATEHTLYAVYNGKFQELKKFQVLVASKHVTEENKEKTTTNLEGLTEDNWYLIGTGDVVRFHFWGESGFHREDILGNYAKTTQIIKGRPVFEQVNKKYFLFVGPNGCWRIGPDVTSYSGSVLKHPKKHKMMPPKSGWLYYHNNKWNKDDNLVLIKDDEEVEEMWKMKERNRRNKKEEAVKSAFSKADTEGTGKLTRDQLKVALLEIVESGHDAAFMQNKEMIDDDGSLTMFIEIADGDGDKLITLDELLFIMELRGEMNDEYKIEWITKMAKAADRDGNGLITIEELRYMWIKCGFTKEDNDEAIDAVLAMVFESADADGAKKIRIEEFVNMMAGGTKKEDPKEKMKQLFRMFDTDKDGFLSKKELVEYLKFMDMVAEDDTPEDVSFMVDMLMAEADEEFTKCPYLIFEEFCSILDKHDQK